MQAVRPCLATAQDEPRCTNLPALQERPMGSGQVTNPTIIDAEITVTIPVRVSITEEAMIDEAWVQFVTLSDLRWKRAALHGFDRIRIESAAKKGAKYEWQ